MNRSEQYSLSANQNLFDQEPFRQAIDQVHGTYPELTLSGVRCHVSTIARGLFSKVSVVPIIDRIDSVALAEIVRMSGPVSMPLRREGYPNVGNAFTYRVGKMIYEQLHESPYWHVYVGGKIGERSKSFGMYELNGDRHPKTKPAEMYFEWALQRLLRERRLSLLETQVVMGSPGISAIDTKGMIRRHWQSRGNASR